MVKLAAPQHGPMRGTTRGFEPLEDQKATMETRSQWKREASALAFRHRSGRGRFSVYRTGLPAESSSMHRSIFDRHTVPNAGWSTTT